jgi:S1-C subfamily serine protease
MMSDWINSQKALAQAWSRKRADSTLEQAYRLYTLALVNQPELGAMNRLRESTELSGVARFQLAAAYKLAQKNGVLVTSVDADSPAAKAGLKAGDVVLKFDGKAIEDASDLREAVNAADGGTEVTLSIQRDGRPMDVKAILAKPETPRRRARTVRL